MRATILAPIALALAACTGGPADPGGDPSANVGALQQAVSATPQNVIVTNPAAQPVPTSAVGTTTVDGTVAATQSGSWSVGISGTPSVSASQSGAWSMSVSNPVALAAGSTVTAQQGGAPWSMSIAGEPTVALDPTTTVAVSAIAGTTNVNVANTPSVTVSNTPSVTVSNTPTVSVGNFPATQTVSFANPPSVNASLATGATVGIASGQTISASSTFAGASKTAIVTVDAYAGRQPYGNSFQTDPPLTSPQNFASRTQAVNVSGKRLVIEQVSAYLTVDSGVPIIQATFGVLDPSVGEYRSFVYLAPTALGTSGGSTYYVANQSLRLYANDRDGLVAFFQSGSNANNFAGTVAFSGYLIDP
jgi:hypothetical protein